MKPLELADYAVIAVFFAVMIGVGVYYSRRSKTSDQFFGNALKLLAIGTVVGVGMGFPLFWSICISGLIIVLYTFLGGLKATLTCDFIQFLVILAVVFALPPLCLGRLATLDGGSGLVHGFSVFLDRVPDGFFDFTGGQYTWVYMLVFFCCVGSTLSTNWSLVQRYYSTKSERDAKKMAYLVAALLFAGPPLFFFPAMAARVFLPGLDMNDADAMNAVYAMVCRHVLPAGMIGMVIAAMFSATMSSLAGNFNAAAAVVTNELYLKVAKNPSAKAKMVAARVATVLVGGLVGGIVVGLAIFMVGASPSLACLREMVWIFPATSAATAFSLFLGTKLLPDSPLERAEVDAFMDRLGKGN